MSSKKWITIMILIVIITNVLTFTLSNIIALEFNNKVIVPAKEYESMVSTYMKYSKIMELEKYIKSNFLYDVDDEKLMDGQIRGMFESLDDPYSVYMDPDEFKSFTEQNEGVYGGVGIIVTPGDDNLITVVSPIEGTPGDRAGIKTGDKIVKVNGEEFTADRMDEAVRKMKGEPNTKVTITILRTDKDGNKEYLDIEIIREEIRLDTVKSDIVEGNIGYINITSFDELTYKDFKEHLNNLLKKNIKGLILDLRNNPGGLLDICVDIADELLGEGIVVYTETKDGERQYEYSGKSAVTLPLVVLVNEGSASASEILAGAIKDHKRGLLIGNRTFGKGIVQRIRGLKDGSGFKLTVSEYFTPNGTSIHGIGIEPDITVDLPEGIMEIGLENLKEDTQLQRAIEEIKNML
ncbi:MAG TPA: S41 family peptidase [Tissierellia bacterium]|nr:S41 family peptidase [Tissierellia bacterium]